MKLTVREWAAAQAAGDAGEEARSMTVASCTLAALDARVAHGATTDLKREVKFAPLPRILGLRGPTRRRTLRVGAGPDGSRIVRRALAFTLIGAIAIAACEATPTPSPSPSSTPAPTSTPTPAASPAAALPITVGLLIPRIAPGSFFSMSNTAVPGFRPPGGRPDLPVQLLYNAIYRYDDSFAPVPDLASEPCDVSADGLTVTCSLVETTFHDGTELTADDVVFTYELARRHPDCLFGFGACAGDVLESVTAPDARTVEFRLKQPDATFLTLYLPQITIDSQAVVEAAYAPLAERAPTLDAAAYGSAADRIEEEFGAEQPDCEGALEGTDELFEGAALEPLPREQFIQADGEFDRVPVRRVHGAAPSRPGGEPRGHGPGRDLARLPGAVLQPGADRHRPVAVRAGRRGRPRGVRGVRGVSPRAAGDAPGRAPDPPRLGSRARAAPLGRAAVVDRAAPGAGARAEAEAQFGMKLATFPDAGYTMLLYNLRGGPAVRRSATSVPRWSRASTSPRPSTPRRGGQGDVIYSPIDPISWAYQPDLVRPERDVAAARELIESSGWAAGRRRDLCPRRPAPGDEGLRARRVCASASTFMDLVAAQVRDCGIELDVVPADQQTVLGPLIEFPHTAAGEDTPFDALFIGWAHTFDPDEQLCHSRWVSSERAAGRVQLDGLRGSTRRRAAGSRLWPPTTSGSGPASTASSRTSSRRRDRACSAWATRTVEALDERLTLTDGEPNLKSRQWFWELEKLVFRGD